MATNSDMVLGALQLLEVVGATVRAPSANDGEYGLTIMNDMCLEWQALGIDLQYLVQTDLTADTPIDESVRQTIKANMAVRMGPTFGKQPSPTVAAMATMGFDRLARDAALANQQTQNLCNLPRDEARRYGTSSRILTG